MRHILISVISDQTIPNLLFIKDKQEMADRYVFLTTAVMEEKAKTQAIVDAAGIGEELVQRVVVTEDQVDGIKNALYRNGFAMMANTHFLVNLTGGTKLMSLAVYEFFRSLNSSFYYLPIGRNTIVHVNPKDNDASTALNYRTNLHEYLTACGLSYDYKSHFSFTPTEAFSIFEKYRQARFYPDSFPVEQAMQASTNTIREENIRGTWFEEYVFYRLKQEMNLTDDAIGCSVMMYKGDAEKQNDNEFDLMYVRDNELYVIECKVTLTGKSPMRKIDGALHKLAAISKNFGLRTHAYIFTLSDLREKRGGYSNQLLRKFNLLNVMPPVDQRCFLSQKKLFL